MRSKNILRGLQDIRTLSGKVDQASNSYMGYMKVSCLEMEKWRRGKERESALQRVQNIETRFREIEEAKAAILSTLSEPQGSPSGSESGAEPTSASGRSRAAFKVRY